MAQAAKRRAETGLRRRTRKRSEYGKYGFASGVVTQRGDPQDHTSSYEEGYWGEIGAISLISPQFHTEFSQRGGGWASVGFWGDFGAPSLAHLSFFASTTGVVTLRIQLRCTSAAHPLRIRCQHFRGVKTTLMGCTSLAQQTSRFGASFLEAREARSPPKKRRQTARPQFWFWIKIRVNPI
jgi:hypothetical protein